MKDYSELTLIDIRNEIVKFNNDLNVQKLENFYHTKSFSEIINVSRKEAIHSNFLAWLLNDKESHSLYNLPLEKFLELLAMNCMESQFEKYKELFDSIIVKDFNLENIYVQTEKHVGKSGRIDIYIEANISYAEYEEKRLKIIIENKVSTKEHSDQTKKYFQYIEKHKLVDDIPLYVFLTPLSTLELIELTTPQCSCKEFIQINYQLIVDSVLEPILNKNIPNRVRNIINEYLQCLSQPALNKEDEEYKQGLIMALGSKERNLLTKFWENNQTLILAAIHAVSLDPEQDKENQENANNLSEALQTISSSKKDRSLYSISFNGVLQKSKFRKADIGLNTIQILEKHNLIDKEVFEFLKNDKTATFPLLKMKEDMSETEKKYRKYKFQASPELTFENQEYYVVRNWGKENTAKFIKKMSKKFPALKYENHE